MNSRLLAAAVLIALSFSAMGQYVRLNDKGAKNGLYFNYDRLWSYNQYEASRWGGGLRYDIGFSEASRLKCLSLDGYVGYGYADERWKWGLMADLQGRSSRKPHLYVGYIHDLAQDAHLRLSSPSVNDLSFLDGLMAGRFSAVDRFFVGGGSKASRQLTLGAEIRYSREQRLYDYRYMYYEPADLELLPEYRLLEARLMAEHSRGLRAELVVGSGHSLYHGDQIDIEPYARLLAQYRRSRPIALLTLSASAQAGITTKGAPYSRMFDLGGHWGSPLLLSQSLVSVRPSEFAANLFAAASAKLGFTKPLFKFHLDVLNVGMRPRPFVQAGALWGHLWGQNDEGFLWHDELPMLSPSRGIAEVGVGIDGLVRWGVADWGVALFYRLTPAAARYHSEGRGANLSLLFTAALAI